MLFAHQNLPNHDRLASAIRDRPALRNAQVRQVVLPQEPGDELRTAMKAALEKHQADVYYTYTPVSFRLLNELNTDRKPVVFISVVSPHDTGYADQQGNRLPGFENVTGLSIYAPAHAKHIETLRDAFPNVRRVGVLLDVDFDVATVESALREFPQIEPIYIRARTGEAVAAVHSRIRQVRADAWYFPQTAYLQDNHKALIPLLRADRIRGLYGWHFAAVSGGTLAMQAAVPDRDKRTAEQIELVLTGTPPAQIAIETASVLRLSGNLEALRELGSGFDSRMLRYMDFFY